MGQNHKNKVSDKPDQVMTYFKMEKGTLAIITVSGILYNVGMIAGPWFEGQLAQRLFDIMGGKKYFADMVSLVIVYIAVIAAVQCARFVKRLYVRQFANHINRDMKQVLYGNIVGRSKCELEAEGAGSMMTKAIADVDTCVEGMRKFTTEVFDTGVVMVAYIALLLYYDWRLAVLSMIFPPIAYVVAEKLKRIVAKSASAYKKAAGELNAATMDRVGNAMTYRVYGQEKHMNQLYEQVLTQYEKKAAFANIWETAMQPIYQIISTLSVVFILWFGAKNVLGKGWTVWNIAAFTTFLSCFMKLAVKSSKAAKLFNAVQKAKVSWQRIKPYLQQRTEKQPTSEKKEAEHASTLSVKNLSFRYGNDEPVLFSNISFAMKQGEIIGVAGPVACGKSTLGKVFLGDLPYEGSIQLDDIELSQINGNGRLGCTAYMGHQPELISASIAENICLGCEGDVVPYLQAVCMDEEISQMPDGIHTIIGNGGVRLSGGQQARIALARTLFHRKKIMILDDPFSAVDQATEKEILARIRSYLTESMVMLISHRTTYFSTFAHTLWMEETHHNEK